MPAGAAAAPATEVALADALAWLDQCNLELGDLPLQVTPVSLRALPVSLQARRQGSAQLVFSLSGAEALTVHSLIDRHASQADARSLVAQLLAEHAGRRIAVPQLQRPDLGGAALERLGFERQPLHQVLMRRSV